MNGLISVIIPKSDDYTYLIRCLNSIKRQTYQNCEIILIANACNEEIVEKYDLKVVDSGGGDSKWAGMNQALKAANGEYICFCSVTSVLSNNCFSKLVVNQNDSDAIRCATAMWMNKGVPVEQFLQLPFFGWLFDAKFIMDNDLMFSENYEFSEVIFVAEYLSLKGLLKFESTDCYVYDSDKGSYVTSLEMSLDEQIVKIFDLMITAFDRDYCDKAYHYKLAESYVFPVFRASLATNNEQCFQGVVKYLSGIESDRHFLKLILSAMNVSEALFEIMKECCLQEYLFYKEKYLEEEDNIINKLIKLETKGVELEKKINKIQELEKKIYSVSQTSAIQDKNINVTTSIPMETLEGPAFADYVTQKYAEGALGLKTLIKAFKNWVKYKLKRA